MPLLGAHLSIKGGYHKAVEAAAALGMDTVQIFTASPQMWPVTAAKPAEKTALPSGQLSTRNNNPWRAKPISAGEVRAFAAARRASGLRRLISHDCYLINLASPDKKLYRQSVEAFVVEMRRAEQLELDYLVTHPGAYVRSTEEEGLARVADALNEALARCSGCRVMILLENTAGQGTSLGYRFEHLGAIRGLLEHPERVGVCFDTCHAFAAGYPLAPADAYRKTMRQFDAAVGLAHLKAFHLNDSLKPLGSRVDRHAHVGRGCLGLEPFRLILNDRRFKDLPMILETPKGMEDGQDLDAINLATLRGLIKGR